MRVNRLRWRLTLLYCAAAVLSGVVLLGIIVVLSRSLPPVAVPVGRSPDRMALATLVQIDGVRSSLLVLPAWVLLISGALVVHERRGKAADQDSPAVGTGASSDPQSLSDTTR